MLPELSDKQLDRLSEFCGNLAIVFIGGIITPWFTGIDTLGLGGVILGLLGVLLSLLFSLHLVRSIK